MPGGSMTTAAEKAKPGLSHHTPNGSPVPVQQTAGTANVHRPATHLGKGVLGGEEDGGAESARGEGGQQLRGEEVDQRRRGHPAAPLGSGDLDGPLD